MIVEEIFKFIPNSKVSYGIKGSDPRNYKVSFNKVKNVLDFEPEYGVSDGIKELIVAFDIGLFSDASTDVNKYGNHIISL
jgi:nucleoside-diphosphate-sugar epimerase